MSRLRHYGFPCMLRTLGMTSSRTLRLGSFTKDAWEAKVKDNISDLKAMVQFSAKQGFKFFRIGSGVVPFGSHPITAEHDWVTKFGPQLREIGAIVKSEGLRISMHPDHFCVLNAEKEDTLRKSIADLDYHAKLLDAMGLDDTHKMQVHVGGVFGDKTKAIARWCETYNTRLSERVRARLVLENDDTRYPLADVLKVHAGCGKRLPILFDTFHHECLNNGEPLPDAFRAAAATWAEKDGPPLLDYSSQDTAGGKKGKHAETLDPVHFIKVIRQLDEVGIAYDVMLEIKDKETSAFKVRLVDPWGGGAGIDQAKKLTDKQVKALVGDGKQYGQVAARVKASAPRGHGKGGKKAAGAADDEDDEAEAEGNVEIKKQHEQADAKSARAGAGRGKSSSGSSSGGVESKRPARASSKKTAKPKSKKAAAAAAESDDDDDDGSDWAPEPRGRKRKAAAAAPAADAASAASGGEPAAKRRRTRGRAGGAEDGHAQS